MAYRAIIFDFFGVFAPDVYPNWLTTHIPNWTAERDYYHRLAHQADEGEITKEQFLAALAVKAGSTPGQVMRQLDSFTLNPDMVELLKQVSKSHKTALLCNASSPIVAPVIVANDLTEYFNEIIFSSDIQMAKPEPRIYQLALRRLNVTAEEAIFIDDRAINIDGAAGEGITALLYTTFPELQQQLAKLGIA